MLLKSTIKYIQKLHHNQIRTPLDIYVAETPKLVETVMAGKDKILEVYTTDLPYWQKCLPNDIKIESVTDSELKRLSSLMQPHSIVAIVKKNIKPTAVSYTNQWIIACDGIQNPGNMGTLLRIAHWFGIRQIVLSHDCVDVLNTKVVQASMGSISHVDIWSVDIEGWIAQLDHTQIQVLGAYLTGKSIYKTPPTSAGVLIVGNEGKGIRLPESLTNICKVTIPRIGTADSLNVSVSTGIMLSHLMKK
ncbi:MAG: RNA methyltransferase [Phycisphaerales bacterium]|nr:RNA methyltransferase [Phycisphaerales bacterium]